MDILFQNNIIISNSPLEGYNYVDIGYELSTRLSSILPTISDASLTSLDILTDIFSIGENVSSSGKKYIALSNISILFERELKINMRYLIESLAKNRTLIICSEGEVNDYYFYPFRSNHEISVDLNNLDLTFIHN